MRYGYKFRLTPPWPPGRETLKKALLGPARYRAAPVAGSTAHVYDDTVLIALAVQAFLRGREEGFRLRTPGLELMCRVDAAGDATLLRTLLGALVAGPPPSAAPAAAQACLAAGIAIEAQVDGVHLQHRAWLLGQRPRSGLRWSPALIKAVETLRSRGALSGAVHSTGD
ncbi:MAG: hypothetical protein E6R07_00415 [Nevskiaceae bacterium]|nr:MAG: hypothetical protein E6R07_00415 [Nevskiaceae bacterium]